MKKVVSIALAGLVLTGCHLFQPKPKEEPAQQSQPAAQPAYTPPVPEAPYKVDFGAGCTVGWRATQEYDIGGQKSQVWWAIVGDAGQSWQVEHVAMGLPADHIMGLTVNKSDGKVTKAVLGKKGEAGKEHPIMKEPAGGAAAQQGTDEQVTIKIGTFPAKKHDHGGGNISWIGTEGDMKGVMLKMAGAAPYELSAKPTSDMVPTGKTTLGVTTYTYSNGMKQMVTNDRIVAAFWPVEPAKRGMFGMEMQGMKARVIEVGSDAKPQLIW